MKKTISQQTVRLLLTISLTCLGLIAYCRERSIPTLNNQEKETYENYARSVFSLLWTNDCSQLQASVYRKRTVKEMPWADDIVVDLRNAEKKIFCAIYFQPGSSNILSAINFEYAYGKKRGDTIPKHSPEQARARMFEIAHLFGVPNLLDIRYYRTTDVIFREGAWEYSSLAVINGYHTSYFSVDISISDESGMPLREWGNTVSYIPNNLPTNVVLTAEHARAKSEHYLKKYYPDKERLSKITFSTNRLEYVRPNSRYIDPAKDEAREDTRGPKDTRLAWVNYFIKNYGRLIESGIPIYVDAATGEMLGGQ